MGYVNILTAERCHRGEWQKSVNSKGQINTFAKETGEKLSSHAPLWLVFMRYATSILFERLPVKKAGKINFRDQAMYSFPAPQRQQGYKHCIPPGPPGMPRPKNSYSTTTEHTDLTFDGEKTDVYLSCGMFFPPAHRKKAPAEDIYKE